MKALRFPKFPHFPDFKPPTPLTESAKKICDLMAVITLANLEQPDDGDPIVIAEALCETFDELNKMLKMFERTRNMSY
jgi:hypothetical protein